MSEELAVGHTRLPIPDPTMMTTAQLERGLTNLKDLLSMRLDGMDKAIEIQERETAKLPALIMDAVRHLQDLHTTRLDGNIHAYGLRFDAIQGQLHERDLRFDQAYANNKISVDAAFAAAKEAVAEQNKANLAANSKMESSFTKQLDAINTLITTIASSSDGKIDDLKSRVALIEGSKKGTDNTVGFVVGIGGLVLAVVSSIVAVMMHH